MKIFVMSDSHVRVDNVLNFLKKRTFDLYIHLGDMVRDAETIEKRTGVTFIKIKGNNDFFPEDAEEERIITVDNKRILMLHGHRQRVYFGLDQLIKKAEEEKADICLFGHSHVYFEEEINGILYINPGSTSMPRGGDYRESCVILTIENNNVEVERILL